MFFRVSFVSLAALALGTLTALSAPTNVELTRRQIGNLQCNINRFQIVGALSRTTSDVQDIQSAGSSDPAVTSAASDALSGLSDARSGIVAIAGALVQGQTAPADARDQVASGLTTAQNALNSITSTDTAVTSAVSTAQNDLSDAITAGQGVVANCK